MSLADRVNVFLQKLVFVTHIFMQQALEMEIKICIILVADLAIQGKLLQETGLIYLQEFCSKQLRFELKTFTVISLPKGGQTHSVAI